MAQDAAESSDSTPAAKGLDRVELTSGLLQHGIVIDPGDNSIRLETPRGATRIHKRDLSIVRFDPHRRSGERLLHDRLEFNDGRTIDGEVRVLDGGKVVQLKLPVGRGERNQAVMKYPMSDVKRIRRKDELVEDRRVYTVELAREIDAALEHLGAADDKEAEEARRFLAGCGVFAIDRIRESRGAIEDDALTEGSQAARTAQRLDSLLHLWSIKCLVPDKVQEFAPDVYDVLALETSAHAKQEFLKWVLPHYPEETTDLTLYIIRNRAEDHGVRAFAVDFLRRLQLNRALIDLYNDGEGEMQFVAAVALARNRILIGAPTLIDALSLDSESLRDLAARTLREAAGVDYRFRANGAPAARELAIARWKSWWEENQESIDQTSRLVLQGGTEESPQWREATRLWKRAHEAWIEKNFSGARELLEKSIAADPTFAKAVISLAVLRYVELGERAEAEKLLRDLIERPTAAMTPRDKFAAHLELGNIARLEEHWDEALEHYDECTVIDPKSALALAARADVAWILATRRPAATEAERRAAFGKILEGYEESRELTLEALEKLTVLDIDSLPESETLPFVRGVYNRSVFETRKGYEREVVRLHQAIARVHHALGDFAAAVSTVRRALDFLDVNSDRSETRDLEAELRNYLAILYERQGRDIEALDEYRKVLRQLDSKNKSSLRGIERLRKQVATSSTEPTR